MLMWSTVFYVLALFHRFFLSAVILQIFFKEKKSVRSGQPYLLFDHFVGCCCVSLCLLFHVSFPSADITG